MKNLAMAKKLQFSEALDVRRIGIEISPGLFELKLFDPEKDYCDAKTENWIWSIGVEKKTGKMIASINADLYGNSAYRCIWLR